MGRKANTPERLLERYAEPEPNTGCWLWTGLLDAGGYGKAGMSWRTVRAHRMSYEHHFGPVPQGLFVCHRCDNPSCVNPGHLFLGTTDDNMRDMSKKGRAARGERAASAKLDTQRVLEVRQRLAEGATARAIAREFGVDESTVARIGESAAWAHIGPPVRNRRPWLSPGAAAEVRRRVALGEPQASICQAFEISRKTVYNIAHGRTRKVA